jgi:hypothetical protein
MEMLNHSDFIAGFPVLAGALVFKYSAEEDD